MGNCVLRGLGEAEDGTTTMIKVVTYSGGVMELYPPLTAQCITNGFPGHGIYRGGGSGELLLHNDELLGGELYYLRPLSIGPRTTGTSSLLAAPYRMSFDVNQHHGFWRRQDAETLIPKCSSGSGGGGSGVWKVKLVISPARLAEILAQESPTEALIESVRTVAKCANGSATSTASSDQWSLASSRKVCSNF